MIRKLTFWEYLVKWLTFLCVGGSIYYGIELIYRQHSHFTMHILGGLCFISIGAASVYLLKNMGIIWQSVIGAIIITVLELLAGIILNLWLGLGIWDYSMLPFNILGQVSLLFTVLWLPLAAFAVWLNSFLRFKIYGIHRPKFKWFRLNRRWD